MRRGGFLLEHPEEPPSSSRPSSGGARQLAPLAAALYRQRLATLGDDPRSNGWDSERSQEVRFEVVARQVSTGDAVLDVGCGLGHLHRFLGARGWSGDYLGLDVLPEMVDIARSRGRPVELGSICPRSGAGVDVGSGAFDVVVGSGLATTWQGSDQEQAAWLEHLLRTSLVIARKAVVLNFIASALGTGLQGSRWCASPGVVADIALGAGRTVSIHRGYLEAPDWYDFTLVVSSVPAR